jgi:hypothetical protein
MAKQSTRISEIKRLMGETGLVNSGPMGIEALGGSDYREFDP